MSVVQGNIFFNSLGSSLNSIDSQPTQTQYQAPLPNVIENDIEILKNWIKEYKLKLRSSN